MYYEMIRLHYEESRYSELMDWAEKARSRADQVNGLVFADLVRTGEGEGMIIAAYADEAREPASAAVAELVDDMAGLLTGTPHGHAGSVAAALKVR